MLTEPGPDGVATSPAEPETKRHRLPRAPLHFRREAGPRPGARRNTALAIALAAVVTASAVGWVAGRRIQSPAEIASRTAPPPASLITVPVELRTLTSDVVARGTVRYGSPQTVTLPASPLKPGTSIVSIAPVKGAALNEGNVALSVSGRPVLVLQGAQPAYRDLGPGAVGEDVRQLQAGLTRLGFNPGALHGALIQATAAVGVAQADVDAAKDEVANANAAIKVAESRVALNAGRVKQVDSAVSQVNGKLGIQLPANEVLFFASLPLRIDDVTVKAGDELTGPVMTVSNSLLAVDGALSLNDAKP